MTFRALAESRACPEGRRYMASLGWDFDKITAYKRMYPVGDFPALTCIACISPDWPTTRETIARPLGGYWKYNDSSPVPRPLWNELREVLRAHLRKNGITLRTHRRNSHVVNTI